MRYGSTAMLVGIILAAGATPVAGVTQASSKYNHAKRIVSNRVPQKHSVRFTIGEAGLTSLSYERLSLLTASQSGSLHIFNGPVFRRKDGSLHARIGGTQVKSELDNRNSTVLQSYPWGTVGCRYMSAGNRLELVLRINNTSSEAIASLAIQLLEPVFPSVPQCRELDAGMFGTGGVLHPLYEYPIVASPRAAPALIYMRYGAGALAFCSDSPASSLILNVPYTTNPPVRTRYPFCIYPGSIAPGATVRCAVSLRFGSLEADEHDLAADVIGGYAREFPFQVRWSDHRAIGTLFLSSNGAHPPPNPRGWFNNAQDVDISTPAGLERFRDRLLRYADDSITILKQMNAQGMITWDPEGQEFSRATYYGDPRLTGRLAPETDYKGPSALACMDEYFRKFREAGLRVGVCVRPQEIGFIDGAPSQTDSMDPTETLKRKIAYAASRWGCTLFYVDSTVKGDRSLDADVFRDVAAAFPNVLLMPENETLRYFAYSAPLNSFQHQGVTSTPPGARKVYPHAFSVILAGEGDVAGHKLHLAAAVRRGDILLFHGWWPNPNNPIIMQIYEQAARDAGSRDRAGPQRIKSGDPGGREEGGF